MIDGKLIVIYCKTRPRQLFLAACFDLSMIVSGSTAAMLYSLLYDQIGAEILSKTAKNTPKDAKRK